MLLHSKLENSLVNGPGNRAVIWFQGCSGMNCPGCWNPDTHAFMGREHTPEENIVEWVASLLNHIDGVTLSGGEPMQQWSSLAYLVRSIHECAPKLSIGMFTGYTLSELENGQWRYLWKCLNKNQWENGSVAKWSYIKDHLDFAVCGRYNRLQPGSDTPLCGSRNQTLELFGDRYTMADFAPKTFEVTVLEDSLVLTGFPPHDFKI